MTPPAHRAKASPKRASRAGGRARVRDAGRRIIERLRAGPVSNDDLTRLLYGDAPPRVLHSLIGALRERGYKITHDWEGYHLVSEPETSSEGRVTRSPAQALYALFTTRGNLRKQCDCGAPATHVALFHQLTIGTETRFVNTLPVCESCAVAFTDAEQILSMEDAYAMAKISLPSPAEPGRLRGRPPASADRPGHGRTGDDPGASD